MKTLNCLALGFGFLAAILLAFFSPPPVVQPLTKEGAPLFMFYGTATPWGQIKYWLPYSGPMLLAASFLLQFMALVDRGTTRDKREVAMTTTESKEPTHETLRTFVMYQGQYHNHKEQLGYAAAAAYTGGAFLLFFSPNRWITYPLWAKTPFLVLLLATGIAGWFYVFWQFYLRSTAASNIDWFLKNLDQQRNWPPKSWGEEHIPHWLQHWGAPIAALLVMTLWAVAALVRVMHGFER